MSLHLLKRVVQPVYTVTDDGLGNPYQEQTGWDVTSVFFDDELEEDVTSQETQPTGYDGENFELEEGQVVTSKCGPIRANRSDNFDTTKFTWHYSRFYGQTNPPEGEPNSAECGYTAPPPAGTLLRLECRGVDQYRITANGSGGEVSTLAQRNATACGYEPSAPVLGCMDAEATNYNELATQDDGTCTYTPRLDINGPARLAAVGVPLLFTMQSAATGLAPSRARLLLTVGAALAEGLVLTINGESFTVVVEKPAAGQFLSGNTLATALAASVTLSARYRISQPAPDQVELVALATGSQLTPTAEVSEEGGGVEFTLTPGVDALRSQTKTDWGCYVEIWAVPGAVWADEEPDLSEAYLVGQLEQLYQASNRYTFDLAPALLPLVGNSRELSTDRLVAYFVRFGEAYVPEGEQMRRRLVVADTPVCWALESAVPVAPEAQHLVLSSPCPGGIVPAGLDGYEERVYVLAPAGAALQLQRRTFSFSGAVTTQTVNVVAAGGVETIELEPLLLPVAVGALRSTFTLRLDGNQLSTWTLQHRPAKACLVLLSRRGAYEAVWFRGLEDPTPKRQPQLYSKGRDQAVRRVNLTKARKLTSGPLTQAGLDWLCDELAGAPEVVLLDPATGQEQAVVVTGFSPDYNEPANQYSLTLDVEPAAPFATLSA